ncbi:HNH endonuclease [Desulfoluna spongiiphila]|uniref:HNH endonuclease n=1 Tax=Desulfoluna spongiiphila TaxID=419481 RepID=UPI0012581CB8|nr:HNH endonuclease [Desulfoluna spongiiphila]VVS92158.1 hnh nuclease [Desulfoluna spongiiphila]
MTTVSSSHRKSQPWTRNELILAINLYCKIPFGTIHIRNPKIIELATLLGRTPGSVSYKLANFASIDPTLDRKGAAHTSKLDRDVWAEFFNNWEEMAYESESQMAALKKEPLHDADGNGIYPDNHVGDDALRLVKTRVNQQFFRHMILSTYDNRCCITGLSVPDLLVASHIVPWAQDKKNRLNPSNGLCLNALHDKAFDRHLISLSDDFKVMVSPRLKEYREVTDDAGYRFLMESEGKEIRLPRRFLPDVGLVRRHRGLSSDPYR